MLDAAVIDIDQQAKAAKNKQLHAKMERCHRQLLNLMSPANQLAWAQERQERDQSSLAPPIVQLPATPSSGPLSVFLHGLYTLGALGWVPTASSSEETRSTSFTTDSVTMSTFDDALVRIHTTILPLFSLETPTPPDTWPTLPWLKEQVEAYQRRDYTNDSNSELPKLVNLRKALEQWLAINPASTEIAPLIDQVNEAISAEQRVAALKAFVASPSQSISDKLLLHILGDSFGQKTGLEGMNFQQPLQFQLEILLAKRKVSQSPQEQDALDLLIPKLQEAIELGWATRDASDRFRQLLESKIEALKPGESFLWPGGWNEHGIYYQVILQGDGNLTFRLYNTGDGLQYHPDGILGTREVAPPYLDFVDIAPANLTSPPVLQAFQELQTLPVIQLTQAQDLYKAILPRFAGSPAVAHYPPESLLFPQMSGTCSYRSLIQTLRWQLPDPSIAKRLEWEAGLKAIHDYSSQHSDRLVPEQTTRNLLLKSVRAFATLTQDLAKAKIIVPSELQYASAIVNQTMQQLENSQAEALRIQEQSAVQVHIQPSASASFNASLTDVLQYGVLPFYQSASPNFPRDYVRIDANSTITPETINSELQRFTATVTQANGCGHSFHVKAAIADFVEALPLPNVPFWASFNATEAEPLLRNIAALSTQYMRTLITSIQKDPRRDAQLRPVDFVVQMKLLAMTDFLLQSFPAALGAEIPTLYTENLDQILFGGHAFFHFDNPSWEDQVVALRGYWRSQHAQKKIPLSLFGVELLNLGNERHLRDEQQGTSPTKDWDANIQWPDFQWLTAFISRPDTKHALESLSENDLEVYKHHSGPKRLAVAALTDSFYKPYYSRKHSQGYADLSRIIKKVIPEAFWIARDLSWLTNSLLQAPLHDKIAWKGGPILKAYGNDYEESGATYPIKTELSAIKVDKQPAKDHPEKTATTYAQSGQRIDPNVHFQQAANTLDPAMWESYLGAAPPQQRSVLPKRRHLSPNEIVTLNPKDLPATRLLSMQQLRTNLGFSSIPELQLMETITAYSQHPVLLSDAAKREAFTLLIFEPGLWRAEFTRRPEKAALLLGQLIQLLITSYQQSKAVGDFSTANGVLAINQRLRDEISFLQKTYPGTIPEQSFPFIDTRAEIHKLLQNKKLSTPQMAALAGTLALSYQRTPTLTADDAITLLKAVSMHQLLHDPTKDRRQNLDLRDLLYTHANALQDLMLGPEAKRILDALYRSTNPQGPLPTWELGPSTKSDFPYIQGKVGDSGLLVNLLQGTLFESGGQKLLPKAITEQPLYKRVVNLPPPVIAMGVAPGLYALSDADGQAYRLFYNRTQALTVQKEISGEWHQYVEPAEHEFPVTALLRGHRHWRSMADDPHLLITTEDGTPYARADLTFDGFQGTVTSIHRLGADGKKVGMTLLNLEAGVTPFSFLTRFEKPKFLEVWQTMTTDVPKEVHLPRYDLSFQVSPDASGELRLQSDQFAGYTVAKNQYVAPMGTMGHYLLLEHATKPPLVVVARQNLKASNANSTLSTDANLVEDGDSSAMQRYLTYEYSPASGTLAPKDEEGRFYLGLLALWQQKYEKASDLLRGFGFSREPLSPAAGEILEWITKLGNHDPDPTAAAIRLQAQAQLAYHFNRLNAIDKFAKATIIPDYGRYLNTLHTLDHRWLHSDEEMLLLTAILTEKGISLSEQDRQRYSNRYQQLQHEPSVDLSSELKPKSSGSGYGYRRGDEKQYDFGDWFSAIEKEVSGATKPSTEVTASLLRPVVQTVFFDAYQLARSEQEGRDSQAFADLYHKVTGAVISPTADAEERKKLIETAFQIMKFSVSPNSPQQKELTAATIYLLMRVLRSPQNYPSRQELREKFVRPKGMHWENFKHSVMYSLHISGVNREILEVSKPVGDLPEQPFGVRTKAVDPRFAQCLRLDLAKVHTDDSLDPCLHYLAQQPATENPPDRAIETLFQPIGGDAMTRRSLAESQSKLNAYWQQPLAPVYDLSDESGLVSYRDSKLVPQIAALKSSVAQQGRELEKVANRHSRDPSQRAMETLQLVGEQRQPLGIDDIVQLFFRRDLARYHAANPGLEPDDIAFLSQETMNYMIDAVALKRLERMSEKIEQIRQTANPNERQPYLQELAAMAKATRSYEIAKHPEYLVFEFHTGFFLRANQVQSLDSLDIRNSKIHNNKALGAVLEMIMGSGKTAVLLPLMSILIAEEGNLAFAIMPEALMASKLKEMERPLGTSFRQAIDVIEIDRQMDKSPRGIEKLLQRLKADQVHGRLVVMSDSSVQGLYLNFVEEATLRHYGAVQQFEKLFAFLGEHGIAVVDEVDAVFDVLKSHHFAIRGDNKSVGQIEAVTVNAVFLFYDVLLKETPQLATNFFSAHEFESVMPFDMAYRTGGKQQLAAGLAQEIKRTLWRTATAQNIDAMVAYLMGTPGTTVGAFPDAVQDTLAVWNEELTEILPLTAKRKLFVHYGPVPDAVVGDRDQTSQRFYKVVKQPVVRANVDGAIPYNLGTASERAELGTDLEALNYNIQMALERGVMPRVVAKEIAHLQSLDASKAAQMPLTRLIEELQLSLHQPLSAEELQQLTDRVNANENLALRLEIVKRYVISKIKVFPKQLNSNAQIYGAIFKMVQAFSGTLWNAQTFPEVFQDITMSDTKERTLQVLWSQSAQTGARATRTLQTGAETADWQQRIDEIYGTDAKGSFIDINGLFRGVPNEQVAQLILAKNPEHQAIAFYNEEGDLMVLSNVNGHRKIDPIELSEFQAQKESLITFWDQQHTFGSDVRLGITAKAIVSFGQHTLMRDLLQAVWRLRQLDLGQTVTFVVQEADRQVITDKLMEIFGEASSPLSLVDLMRYAEYNEVTRRGDHNFRALRNKLAAVYIKKIFPGKVDYNTASSLFSSTRISQPRHQYGKGNTEIPLEQALKDLKSEIESIGKGVSHLYWDDQHAAAEEVQAVIDKARPYLPDKVAARSQYGQELTVDTETETDSELNTNKQTNRMVQFDSKWDAVTVQWNRLALEEPQAFIPLARDEVMQITNQTITQPLLRLTVGANEALGNRAFDPGLLASLNVWPLFDTTFSPFGLFQKAISQMLVVRHEDTGAVQVVLLDPKEAKTLEDWMLIDSRQGKTKMRTSLYQLGLGVYQGPPVDNDPAFQRLLAQAIFLQGRPNLNADEQKAMRLWLQDKSDAEVASLRHFYLQTVLQMKEESQADFPDSVLDELLSRT